jgi:hypothetical protein
MSVCLTTAFQMATSAVLNMSSSEAPLHPRGAPERRALTVSKAGSERYGIGTDLIFGLGRPCGWVNFPRWSGHLV